MTRSRLSAWTVCLALAGCGFHPLYGGAGVGSAKLASVYVDIIPNRSGQLLRQALQARLEGDQTGVAKRFTLGVAYSENVAGLGVQSDNSTTRIRNTGLAVWSLHPSGSPGVRVAGGTVRSLDGYNIINSQFFYFDLSQDAVEHRLADALADQIVTGLAAYFEKHPAQG